jgi:hypothetical protein
MNTLDLKTPIDSLMAGIEKATEDAFVASLIKLGLPVVSRYDILKYAPQIEMTSNGEFGVSYYYLGRGKREFLFTSRWTTPSLAEFSSTGKCTSSFEISFVDPNPTTLTTV